MRGARARVPRARTHSISNPLPPVAPEFADDFDGPALDATTWTVRNASMPNDSLCRAARCMAGNVEQRGGALVLTARREESAWAAFTTGAVDSHGKRGWGARAGAPARICVKGVVPTGARGAGAGYWPCVWARAAPRPAPPRRACGARSDRGCDPAYHEAPAAIAAATLTNPLTPNPPRAPLNPTGPFGSWCGGERVALSQRARRVM